VAARPVAAVTAGRGADDGDDRPSGWSAAAMAGCLYGLLLAAAIAWLWWRDRIGALQTEALGRHGVLAAAGVGLATGAAGAMGIAFAFRRVPAMRALADRLRAAFGPLREPELLCVVLFGAVSEEVFFRLAVQDAAGLPGSVAAYALSSTCTSGLGLSAAARWAWFAVAAAVAFVFGLIMQSGFGLLGVTIANAVTNYLCLRRILSP
jgi:membrane protease YdiL (CAAX protease family)